MMKMTRPGLIAKRAAPALDALAEAAAWFTARGITPLVDADTAAAAPDGHGWTTAARARLLGNIDTLIVFGGDGTLLEAASAVTQADVDVPLLGVNLGRLGFLTEVGRSDMTTAFEALLEGRVTSDDRLMLSGRIERRTGAPTTHVALNDIVITRGALSRMIEVTVEVDGRSVCQVKADGLIVATATGSTAYNLSAGGPIVHPAVDALLLTPIAPHTLTNRPIVVPADAVVTLRPVIEPQSDIVVTFDGQFGAPLDTDDVVDIGRSSRLLRLARTSGRTHFDMLREKLRWGR